MKTLFALLRRSHPISLLAILACFSLGASAQQSARVPTYDVELIIFRHLTAGGAPEEWGLEAGEADQRLAIPDEEPNPFSSQTTAPSAPAESFPALPSSKYKLTALEGALRRSRHYRPLAHFGWTQPGFARNDARYFPVHSMVPSSSGVGGQIALTRGRYLHLTIDLILEPPEEPGRRYVLRQTRRMRSNERHYLDHPKFGVIAVITPTE